jgi:hypothetical protein
MNLTLALDEELVARAREVARKQGTSLNEMVRGYLESVAGRRHASAVLDELKRSWSKHPGRSGGRKIARDEAYEGRNKGRA